MSIGILVLILLIIGSAFFSGIESAFISLGQIDRIEIENSKSKNRKILLKLLENKEKLLSTILIGNNVVNIGASALNTALAIHYSPQFGITPELAVTLSALFLTFVILLFGEILPKNIALLHNRSVSLWVAPVIYIFSLVLTPITYFMTILSRQLSWVLSGKKTKEHFISENTVINVVSKGEELGVINKTEKNLIENVFLFDEREVYPIMTPRTAVFALNASKKVGEVKEEILEKQFSRIPVYKESIDEIIGIVYFKTAFREYLAGRDQITLEELAVKPIFVYETWSISNLLNRFKKEQTHIAVVVDEYGGMAGIVTLEDVLEELVGEIFDEKDVMTSFAKKVSENKWMISGDIDIMTVNKNIKGEIRIEGGYETLQGLIMTNLDKVPKVGDSVKVPPHTLTVIKMSQNKILSVLVEYNPLEDPDPEQHRLLS